MSPGPSLGGVTEHAATNGVPAYREQRFAAKSSRYCVAVFVINEGQRLLGQLGQTRATGLPVDVVIADGGSTDASTEPGRLAELGVTAVLVKAGPGALSAQMRMAFDWALGCGYEGVVVMDGNGKDDPSGIGRMIEALDAGVDHVQGSRYVPGGRGLNTPPIRHLAVRLIHAPLLSLAARHWYTDTTNGFRAYSARLLRDPRIAVFRPEFDRYQLHYYLAVRAARLGFTVTEVPVTRTYPAHGPIPTKIRSWRGSLGILLQLVMVCAGRFNPRPAR